jgi:hypothetical protein
MVNNQCAQCGRELRKNLTRCRYCEDLKYQAEITSPEPKKNKKEAVKSHLEDFKQRISEMKQNKKVKKIDSKQSQLDSAFAWGNAISSLKTNSEEVVNKNSKQNINYCGYCGQKLNSIDSYCSKCGHNLLGDMSHSEIRNNVYPNWSKRKLFLPMVVIFIVLLLFGFISSQDFNNPSGGSNTTPASNPSEQNSREYITGLTIGKNFSDFSDAGAIAEDVCSTARNSRIVLSSRGGVGVDPKTASFLKTDDGMQGCIDGFNGVTQD